MSEENKKQSSGQGTATAEAPGPNTVRVTFLPANKTFEFERGELPYADHGKPESQQFFHLPRSRPQGGRIAVRGG
jgi:hypothetical protein